MMAQIVISRILLNVLIVASTGFCSNADLLPSAAEASVVVGELRFRVQALSSTLLRIERAKPSGDFEDRLTFLIRKRKWPGVPLRRINSTAKNVIEFASESYAVKFDVDSGKGAHGVRIQVLRAPTGDVLWTGDANFSGIPAAPRMPQPSRLPSFWAFRDAPRLVPPDRGPTPPLRTGSVEDNFDIKSAMPDSYFFLPLLAGYESFRAELLQLTGPVPVLPDFVFGTWFSWYHNYTQWDKQQEVEEFSERGFPLDASGLDMDWRIHPCYRAQIPNCSHYAHEDEAHYVTNKALFPNIEQFTQWLHARNITLFLNDHPMMIDAYHTEMSPKEIQFRWDGLTSLMSQGVDFWWFDCHWSSVLSGINCKDVASNPDDGNGMSCDRDGTGIDYVAWEKYVQFEVMKRFNTLHGKGATVQLGCSNSGHLADHRYPVWWTGDNTYEQLATAVADMVNGGLQLKPYVHPDCGGHHGPWHIANLTYPGEVYARWIQFCSFGTVLRLHSDPSYGRQPWRYGDDVAKVSRSFMRMRLALLPTLVAAGRRASVDGTPLARRLDLEFPGYVDAAAPDQYLLGDDLLVAPVDPWAGGARGPVFNRERKLWLPPGQWEDAWTGRLLTGPIAWTKTSTIETMPVFHRRPGILVCADAATSNGHSQDWSRLIIEAFPGSGMRRIRRDVYNPNRLAAGYQNDQDLLRPIHSVEMQNPEESTLRLRISCERVEVSCDRSWILRIHLLPNQSVRSLLVDGTEVELSRDATRLAALHDVAMVRPAAQLLFPTRSEGAGGMAPGLSGATGVPPPQLAGPVVEVLLPAEARSVREVLVSTDALPESTFV
eukprot:TRINITY_DN55075_c0_g1_i1.p1 TRINITY_DN55075_c0_g1~~TRINITY_DN55075_c0_g1_i1.p1  ORF type:complete len:827 (-),score=78.73 TRINITY_DN55075_c0_g1_i1:56-2536(-)